MEKDAGRDGAGRPGAVAGSSVGPLTRYLRPRDRPATSPENERGRKVTGLHIGERGVRQVHFDEVGVVTGLQAGASPARTQQIGRWRDLVFGNQNVPAARHPAGVRFDLPQLLERIYPDVRVRADGEPDAPVPYLHSRQKPVAKVPLRSRAGAHGASVCGDQVQLALVGMRSVHYGGIRAEEVGLREKLDGPHAVFGEAVFYLTLLLAGVGVYREILVTGVSSDVFQPCSRDRPDAVGRDTYFDQRTSLCPLPEIIDPLQERLCGGISQAREAAPRVRDR